MKKILELMKIKDVVAIKQMQREEDQSYYDVYFIETKTNKYILKKTNEIELSNYTFFNNNLDNVPKIYNSIQIDNDTYILIDFFEGNNLCFCNKDDLQKTLDALISIQNKYWNIQENDAIKFKYIDSLKSRIKRGEYLKEMSFKNTYDKFLDIYQKTPKTFCHDDLLPFNVLVNKNKACIIDWCHAGILSYPTSLARLIAHTEENKDAFFYMTEEDKQFAIKYYYDNFIKYKNIKYEDYIDTLDYFIFYEYMEWIMLGEKYNNQDSDRYKDYYKKAIEHIEKINNKK